MVTKGLVKNCILQTFGFGGICDFAGVSTCYRILDAEVDNKLFEVAPMRIGQ